MEELKNLASPEIIWFVIGLILFLAELAAPGLILFFFGVGAWIAALFCLIWDIGLTSQLILFIVSSSILLALLRKNMQRLFSGRKDTGKNRGENYDDFIGEQAVVVEVINPPMKGKVELHGTNWNAESETEIPAGAPVRIIGKKNLTLIVKQV